MISFLYKVSKQFARFKKEIIQVLSFLGYMVFLGSIIGSSEKEKYETDHSFKSYEDSDACM